ncbi:MAG: hypothetical protein MRY83_13810, partial [Flavobacteriales bacterium]|nr:hypothetical protein [Flavobacteriales bacterium]
MNRFYLLSIIVLLALSCKKEIKVPKWDVDAVLPIAHSTLAVSNIKFDSVPELQLQQTNDNKVQLVYSNSLFSIDFDSLFQVPDTSITESYPIFIPLNFNPGQQIWTGEIKNKYKLNDIELRDVKFRSGKMILEMTNSLTEKLILDLSLNKGHINGSPFVKQVEIPAGTISSPSKVTVEYDVSDLAVDLTGTSGGSYNNMFISYTLTVDPNGNAVSVGLGDVLSVKSTFQKLIPDYGRGYFGQIIESETLDQRVKELENVVAGNLELQDFDVDLEIVNRIGVDLQSTISHFSSYNSRTGNTVDLNHSIIGNSINLNRAKETGNPNSPVDYEIRRFPINNSNSNILDFLENFPDSLSMAVDIALNPLGNFSAHNDFVYYENGLDLNLNMTLPLTFSASGIEIWDTLALDLDSNDIYSNINSGFLKIYANNSFPLGIDLELTATDSTYSFKQILTTDVNNSIDAGVVQGALTTPKESLIEVPLNQEIINSLYNGELLLIKATLNTNSTPNLV